jgi:hypothetical protein
VWRVWRSLRLGRVMRDGVMRDGVMRDGVMRRRVRRVRVCVMAGRVAANVPRRVPSAHVENLRAARDPQCLNVRAHI